METFPFKQVIIALIAIMIIVAGVGLYLGSNDSPSPTTTTTTPPTTTTTPPTTTTTPPTTTTTTPQMTPGEQAYRIIIENRAAICSQARNALSELMANLQIGDNQWRVNVLVQLSMIQAVYNEAIDLDPPSSMAAIHDEYVQSMTHYEAATHLITQGIEEPDADLLEQAIVEINTGSQLIVETIELLNEFIAAHSP